MAIGHVVFGVILVHLAASLLAQAKAGIWVDHFRVHHFLLKLLSAFQ